MSEPVQNSDGKYIASGGRTFDTRGEAQRYNAAYGSGSSDGFIDGLMSELGNIVGNIIAKIIRLIPVVIGFTMGFVIVMMMKLRLVGKIILTAITFIISGFLFRMIVFMIPALMSKMRNYDGSNDFAVVAVEITIFALAILVSVWFWKFHYKIIKRISGAEITKMSIKFAKRCFFGSIYAGVIVVCIAIFTMGQIGIAWIFAIPFTYAIISWFIKIYGYKDTAENRVVWTAENAEELERASEAKNEESNAVTATVSGAAPTEYPSDDKRCSKGDHVWAQKKKGKLYFAVIDETSNAKVKITFFDGVKAEVNREDIFYLTEAQNSDLKPQAYWESGGGYWKCVIIEKYKDNVKIKYTYDNTEEVIPYKSLMFKK